MKNHKNIGSLSNTGQDPLKNQKATKPESNGGPSRNNDGPHFAVVFGYPHQLKKSSY